MEVLIFSDFPFGVQGLKSMKIVLQGLSEWTQYLQLYFSFSKILPLYVKTCRRKKDIFT